MIKKIVFGLFFTIFLLSVLFGKNAPRGSYFYLINGLASDDLTTAQNGDQIHLYLRPNAQCYLKSVLKTFPSGNMEMKEQVFLDASIKNLILEYVYHSEEIIVPFFDTVLAWQGANTMPYHSKDSSVFFIYTPEDLAYFSQNCHSKWMTVFTDSSKAKSNILILNDLDLGGGNNVEWMPIGVCDTGLYFHANIDGNNKKIIDIYINCENLPSKKSSFIYQAAGVRIEKMHFVGGKVFNISHNGASGLCLDLLNSEILSCSNGMLFYSDMKGISNNDHRRAICGFVQRFYCCVLKDNLFFGDIISRKSAQVGFFSSAFQPVPYSTTNRRGIVQNCINYGHLIHADSINPNNYYNVGIITIFERDFSLKGCINLGLIYPKGNGILVSSNSSMDEKDSCFLDNQMCPNIMIFSAPKGTSPCRKCLIDSDTLSTRRLLGSGLRSRIGNSDAFIFENGFYPRLKNIDERVGRLSSSPLILAEGENVLGVSSDFYVDTNYGVRWESSAPDIVSIEGNKGILKAHAKDTLVKVYARLEGFSKHIYLNIKSGSPLLIESNAQGVVKPYGNIRIREGDSLSIEIRPNPQCYLRKIILEDSLGNSTEVKTGIYADKDSAYLYYDYVHSSLITNIEISFDTVLPWSGTHTVPHRSKDSAFYRIYTPEELAWFAYMTRSSDTFCFVPSASLCIMNDFDLGGNQTPPKEWIPIGNQRSYPTDSNRKGYWGLRHIDGQNKQLRHIYINRPNNTGVGLISCVSTNWTQSVEIGKLNGIHNWHIINGLIIGKSSVGGFVGAPFGLGFMGCSNGSSIQAIKNGAGGIFGMHSYQRNSAFPCNVVQCINFGDIYGQTDVGGILGSFDNYAGSKYCINWGFVNTFADVDSLSYLGGIAGREIKRSPAPLDFNNSHNFNMGFLPETKERSISGLIVGKYQSSQSTSLTKTFSCLFSDNNLCPLVSSFIGAADTPPSTTFQFDSCGIYSTSVLTDSAYMSRKMKNNNAFIFENGFYPRLKNIDERVGRLSSSPLILAEGENVLGVSSDFYVDTNYGVRWESSAPDIVSIEGNKGILKAHAKDTLVKVYARLEGFSKHIYLTVKPRSFYEKSTDSSLCMGDSCFFDGIYRKESGEYRDTLYRSGQNDMDSIFVLNLDFYPASDTSIKVFAFSKDLPYVFNGKSYPDFGKDTLYYTNVYGCDSIVYFSLEETKISYRIRITTNAGGQVNPIRDMLVDRGDSLRISWQADTCFILDSLFIDNRLYSFAGNNSYLFTNIITDHSIRFVFKSDSIYLDSISRPDIHCGQEFLDFRFRVKAGHPSYYDLDFDREAIQKGFVQERKNIEHNPQEVSFRVPLKPYVNTYFAYLYAGNAQGCKSQTYTIPVEIHYPAQDVVRQKWKDVLAVRNDEYNGGYFFTAFQWIQDDKILKKDTLFRLFQPKGLRKGSVYRVLLSRKDGTTISSCPIIPTFEEVSTFNVYPNPIKENGSISIQIDDCQESDCGQLVLIDIQGKIISVHPLKGGLNTYATTLKQGLYMVEIKRETGEKRVLKLIVVK